MNKKKGGRGREEDKNEGLQESVKTGGKDWCVVYVRKIYKV